MTTNDDSLISQTPAGHPLLERRINSINSWREWLDRWHAALDLEQYINLLHNGFNVNFQQGHGETRYDWVDRIIFYLQVANNWRNSKSFNRYQCIPEHNCIAGKVVSPMEVRRIIAQKAFDMLCLNFFRLKPHESFEEFMWKWGNLMDPRLIPILMWFFQTVEGTGIYQRYQPLQNLEPGVSAKYPNQKHAVEFLLEFAQYLWSWKPAENYRGPDSEIYEKRDDELKARINETMPWMVDVLYALNKLYILEKFALNLNEECLERLKIIALSYEFRTPERKKVETVEEACYVGSPAAWLIMRHRIMSEVHNRLLAIEEAQRTKQLAEERLAELTKKVEQ